MRKQHIIKTHSDESVFLGIIFSVFLHVFVVFVFLVLTNLWTGPKEAKQNFVTVELIGGPAAPAAPAAKVNEGLKGPDAVELPQADPQQFESEPQKTSSPIPIEAPDEVIPLAPEIKEKPPEIKKTETKPPKVEVPKVKEVKPKPSPVKPKNKPKSGTSDPLAKRMKELERKVAAQSADNLIESRIGDIARQHGAGSGEFSQGGQSSGTRIDPEKAAYYRHIRDIVSANWIAPLEGVANDLYTIYQLKIEPDGRISSTKLIKSSGNEEYDMSVLRALNKSSPFPPLPDVFGGVADNPAMRFDPQR